MITRVLLKFLLSFRQIPLVILLFLLSSSFVGCGDDSTSTTSFNPVTPSPTQTPPQPSGFSASTQASIEAAVSGFPNGTRVVPTTLLFQRLFQRSVIAFENGLNPELALQVEITVPEPIGRALGLPFQQSFSASEIGCTPATVPGGSCSPGGPDLTFDLALGRNYTLKITFFDQEGFSYTVQRNFRIDRISGPTPPAITDITARLTPNGLQLLIEGENLCNTTAINFNGRSVQSFLVIGTPPDCQLQVLLLPGPSAGILQIITPNGTIETELEDLPLPTPTPVPPPPPPPLPPPPPPLPPPPPPETTVELSISKTDGINAISDFEFFDSLSGTLTYSITVTNTGDGTATGVVLTDTLPPELEFISASDSACTLSSSSPDVVVCSIGELAPDATLTLQIVAAAPSPSERDRCIGWIDSPEARNGCEPDFPLPSTLTNTVAVDSEQTTSVSDTDLTTITIGQDVGVFKSGASLTGSSQGYTYFFDVFNNTSAPTTSPVTLTDSFPSGFVAQSVSTSSCSLSLTSLTCDFGTLDSFDFIPFSVFGTFDTTGVFVNVVTVTLTGDVNPSNNTSTVTTTVTSIP